jgi:predicted aconitase
MDWVARMSGERTDRPALAGSIANSPYHATENRAPEARVAIAATANGLGSVAIGVAVQRLRGRDARWWFASAPLWWGSVLLRGK